MCLLPEKIILTSNIKARITKACLTGKRSPPQSVNGILDTAKNKKINGVHFEHKTPASRERKGSGGPHRIPGIRKPGCEIHAVLRLRLRVNFGRARNPRSSNPRTSRTLFENSVRVVRAQGSTAALRYSLQNGLPVDKCTWELSRTCGFTCLETAALGLGEISATTTLRGNGMPPLVVEKQGSASSATYKHIR